jgi:hypothetical protein
MTIEVRNPDADPFSHKLGGTNATGDPLLDYLMEMMGAKPAMWRLRDPNNPEDHRWEYMYYDCLANHGGNCDDLNNPVAGINQLELVKRRLIKSPSSRKNQAITWYPPRDTKASHTPCLQSLWFNTVFDGDGKPNLDLQYRFRSRNVVDASFGNMLGIYMIGCDVRDAVEEARGERMGMRLVETNNSYHVNALSYGKYLELVKGLRERAAKEEVDGSQISRFETREEVIEALQDFREYREGTVLEETRNRIAEEIGKGRFKGDLEQIMAAETERVHKVSDRVFYLLNKYAPKKNGS